LIYIGDGAWLPEIPARDLTIEEIEKLDISRLLASGLYEEPEQKVEAIPKKKLLED